MFLIQSPAGERMLVESLDGHEGWKVLDKNTAPPPDDFSRLDANGNWTQDVAAKEAARIALLSRPELIAEIMQRLGK